MSLAYSSVTMDAKQEPAPLIVNRKSEVFLVLGYLTLAPYKTTLLTAPDVIL